MKIKGVIFDFNGVIVDDYPLQKEVWNKISMRLRGKPVSDSEMTEKIRGVRTEAILHWMSCDNIDENEVHKLIKKKDELIKQLYFSSSLFKLNQGLENFFNKLKERKILITIATSSTFEMTKFSFDKLGLEQWFEFSKLVYNDGKHEGKPHPGPYLLAALKLRIKPGECVVFEDAKSGIISAQNAGIGKIIAVGSDDRLISLRKLPGVSKAIHNFSEISVKDILR